MGGDKLADATHEFRTDFFLAAIFSYSMALGFLVVRLRVCILQYFTVRYGIIFHHTVFYCQT